MQIGQDNSDFSCCRWENSVPILPSGCGAISLVSLHNSDNDMEVLKLW